MLKILQVSLACATTAQPGALQHRRAASPAAERGHVFGVKTDVRMHSLQYKVRCTEETSRRHSHVRMNSYIPETKRVRAIKFGYNMSLYCTQT